MLKISFLITLGLYSCANLAMEIKLHKEIAPIPYQSKAKLENTSDQNPTNRDTKTLCESFDTQKICPRLWAAGLKSTIVPTELPCKKVIFENRNNQVLTLSRDTKTKMSYLCSWDVLRKTLLEVTSINNNSVVLLSNDPEYPTESFDLEAEREHSNIIKTITASNNPRFVLIGCNNGSTHVLDRKKNQYVYKTANSSCISLSANGDFIAKTNIQGSITVQQLSDKKHMITVKKVLHGAILPDNKHLITISCDGIPEIWNIIKTQPVGAIPIKVINYTFNTNNLWDGKIYLKCSNDLVLVYNINNHTVVNTFNRDSIPEAFSPDGNYLITSNQDGDIILRDAASYRIIRKIDHAIPIKKIHFSPDGKLMVSLNQKEEVEFWQSSCNIQTPEQKKLLIALEELANADQAICLESLTATTGLDPISIHRIFKSLDNPTQVLVQKTYNISFNYLSFIDESMIDYSLINTPEPVNYFKEM